MVDRFIDSLGAWDAWTAIGTILLATATFTLARKTHRLAIDAEAELEAIRKQADAVADQAAASRQQAEATERLAIGASAQAEATERLATRAADQAAATEQLARMAAEQASIAAAALASQTRPHLVPSAPVVGGMEPGWGLASI